MKKYFYILLYAILSLALCGCGATTPSLQEYGLYDPGGTQQKVINIAAQVSCELHKAIKLIIDADTRASRAIKQNRSTVWLEKWGVLVTLSINVIEKTDLSPSVSLNQPISSATSILSGQKISTSQSFAGALSGDFALTATRNGAVHMFFTVQDLLREPLGTTCLPAKRADSFVFIESEIGLKEWLIAAVSPATTRLVNFPVAKDKGPLGQDAISQEFKFQVLTSAGLNPSWKLVNITANTGASLLMGSRDRYQDLLVTLGPVDTTLSGRTTLAPSAFALHQAQQFGIFTTINSLR